MITLEGNVVRKLKTEVSGVSEVAIKMAIVAAVFDAKA